MGDVRLTNTDYSHEWPPVLRHAAEQAPLNNIIENVPTVVIMNQPKAATMLQDLLTRVVVTRVIDNYDEQLAELLISRQPQLYQATAEIKQKSLASYIKQHYDSRPAWRVGSWVYYPWNGELVHVLEPDLFLESRSIRNRDLLTQTEQKQFYGIAVGCAGMSVGSNAAIALILQGGACQLKIADGAVVSASNLNRILTGVNSVGVPKSLVVARKLYEMNPYINLVRYDCKLDRSNIDTFFNEPFTLQVIVDEIDDLQTKILLRLEARKRRIPVLMATDLGDNVMLDVERFDQNPKLPLFHGLAGDIEKLLDQDVSKREWLKHATSIINTKNVPLTMQASLLKIGSRLVTQPQLGGTAMMAGATLAYAVRQIALDLPLKSGRSIIALDQVLDPRTQTIGHRLRHKRHTKLVQRMLRTM